MSVRCFRVLRLAQLASVIALASVLGVSCPALADELAPAGSAAPPAAPPMSPDVPSAAPVVAASPTSPSASAPTLAPLAPSTPGGASSVSPLTGSVAKGEPAHGGAPLAPKKSELFEPELVEWNPKWAKFRTYEFVLTAVQGVAALAAQAIPGGPRWTSHNGFDDAARNVLRAKTLEGARTARDVSDAGLILLVNQRLVDDTFVAWWYHGKGSVAWQMSLIDLETLSFATAVNSIVAGAIGRQRPYAEQTCTRPIEQQTANCSGSNRYRSFFSGHATAAFTLAGLTCMHHAYIPLYGNKYADGAACAGTMAAATTVAMMRVVSDQHYLSDIIVGAAFGTASGLGLPWLLHYRGGGTPEKSDVPAKPPAITATVMPAPNGIFVMGSF